MEAALNAPARCRRVRLHFSLRTLLIFVLLAGSAMWLQLNWEPWAVARTIYCEHPYVEHAEFSPDGKLLLTHSTLNSTGKPPTDSIQIWDVVTGKHVAQIRQSGFLIAAFSPDGRYIIADAGMRKYIYDAATGKSLFSENDSVYNIAFSVDASRFVAIYKSNGTIVAEVWNGETRETVNHLLKPNLRIHSGSISADNRYLLIHSSQHSRLSWCGNDDIPIFLIYDMAQLESKPLLVDSWGTAHLMHDDSLGLYLARSVNETVQILDQNGIVCSTLPGQLPYSPISLDESKLAVCDNSVLRIYDSHSLHELFKLKGMKGEVGVAYSPDASRVFARDDAAIYILDLKSKTMLRSLSLNLTSRLITNDEIQWGPDRIAIGGGKDRKESVTVLELRDGGWFHQFSDFGCVSPQVDRVVTYSPNSNTAEVFRCDDQEHIGNLTGHSAPIQDVAWSPDGKRILTAALDGTARLWEQRRNHTHWGLFALPEMWLSLLLGCALCVSIASDVRWMIHAQRES